MPSRAAIWYQSTKFEFYIEKGMNKKSYKRRDYKTVAEKQQFNTARKKLPSPVIQRKWAKNYAKLSDERKLYTRIYTKLLLLRAIY